MVSPAKQLWKTNGFAPLLLLGTAFLLYGPVLNKYLASDDFHVMYRVGVEGKVFVHDFFRPLSDITLYISYRLGGFNPVYYNAFSIIIHAFTGFFIFLFCRRNLFIFSHQPIGFAWIAALLFISYPFHNESIVWGVGRGSALAAFFAMASLLVISSNIKKGWQYCWCCLFYFIGLSAYESIFSLPLIVLILLWKKGNPLRQYVGWVVAFLCTILLHLLIRFWLSGSILGSYAGGIFSLSPQIYLLHFFKMTGRLFLPPLASSYTLIFCYIAVMLLLFICITSLFKMKYNEKVRLSLSKLIACLFISFTIPLTFPVSTRTSESDRLLYFPSIFVCMLIAYLVTELAKSSFYRWAIAGMILTYNILFLELNNANWRKASLITTSLLHDIKARSQTDKDLVLLNIPDELNGAFILRNGFREALLIHHIDTARIKMFSHLRREQYEALPAVIESFTRHDSIFIPPSACILPTGVPGHTELLIEDSIHVILPTDRSEIWYWNKNRLVKAGMLKD